MSAISQQMHSFQAPGRIILRQGFLLRRVLGVAGRPSWDRRFFTLTSDGMLNYYSEAVLARNPAAFLCSTDGSQVAAPRLLPASGLSAVQPFMLP